MVLNVHTHNYNFHIELITNCRENIATSVTTTGQFLIQSFSSKKQTNLLEDDEFRPDALGKEDRRPPPSTPQVPRSNNRSVSGKDRSYRGLLQQKEKRKLRALVRHCLVNRSSV